MKITFLGTRGGIKSRSPEHQCHSSTIISSNNQNFLIDLGSDWLNQLDLNCFDGIFITHAHKDHIGGLTNNITIPIYTTYEIANLIPNKIKGFNFIEPYKPIFFNSLNFMPFPVYHSMHTPSVGYRISSINKTILYIPDVLFIEKQKKVFKNVDLYIGDGAIISRTLLIRKKNNIPWGHAPITYQLSWCKEANIKNVIFTHCGTEIVRGNPIIIQKKIENLSKEFNINITIAYDGLTIDL